VKPGEVGEVIARGPNIMQGYWKKEPENPGGFERRLVLHR